MKKKLISALLIIVIMLSYSSCIFADDATITYTRDGGNNLNEIAHFITDDLYIDGDYSAYSNAVTYSDIDIYNYNTTEELEYTEDDLYTSSDNNNQFLYYTIKLGEGNQQQEEIATFIYNDAITYNGNEYDVKLNLKKIIKIGNDEQEVRVRIGNRTPSTENQYDVNTYDRSFNPNIGVKESTENNVEVDVEYYILDSKGNEKSISGLFKIDDIDLNQGVYIDDFVANEHNMYMYKYKHEEDGSDTEIKEIKYKIIDDKGTYIYSSTDEDNQDRNAYALMADISKIGLTFTFEKKRAYSGMTFTNGIIKRKLLVTYDAKGGTPTPEKENVIPEEKAKKPSTNPTKTGYTFEGWQKTGETTLYDFETPVTENINLDAVWKPVIYNINYILNGGINDSTNPSTYTIEDTIDFKNPTRDGYDFLGWYEDENFTTKKDGISGETGDKTVYAKWEAKKDTPYKVEHYKETENGNYELVVTDELTGETGAEVTAKAKEYPGFEENTKHEDRISEGTVAGDGSLVLKLYYDKIKYTVTFDTKGGSQNPDNQIVEYQNKATKPTNPTKSGYTFKYWYYVNENGEEVQYNFDDPVTSDVDLIAKWEKVEVSTSTSSTKTDTTTSAKTLPAAGKIRNIVMLAMVIIAAVFGIRYFGFRDIK